MKRIFLSVVAITLTLGVFAQETEPTTKDTIPATTQNAQSQNVFLMQDGKMYVLTADGAKSDLTADTTLSNGTVVTTTGTVKTPDGLSVTLKDGQYIDKDGNIGEWRG
ncbi:MAG: DUF6799 domain-containing protein [Ginsengibacter sp.]